MGQRRCDIEQTDGCRTAPDEEEGLHVSYTEALGGDVMMAEWWLGSVSRLFVCCSSHVTTQHVSISSRLLASACCALDFTLMPFPEIGKIRSLPNPIRLKMRITQLVDILANAHRLAQTAPPYSMYI